MSSGTLVAVARYTFPHEAELARIHLEASGIPSVLMDHNTINVNWLYSNAMGGVRLMVHRNNLEAARQVLTEDFSAELDGLDPGEAPAEAQEYLEEAPEEIVHCPRCGSSQLEAHTKGRLPFLVTWLFLGAPLLLVRKGKKCKVCGEFVTE